MLFCQEWRQAEQAWKQVHQAWKQIEQALGLAQLELEPALSYQGI